MKRADAAEALLQLEGTVVCHVEEEITGTGTQTNLQGESISKMEEEVQRLLEENRTLKQQLSTENHKFDLDFFKEDDDKVNIIQLL